MCYPVTTVALVQSTVLDGPERISATGMNESGTKPSVWCAHQPPEADL